MPIVHPTAAPELGTTLPAAPATRPRPTAPAFVDAHWLVEHHASVHVLDTRRADEHAAGHVPASTSLPLDELLVDDSSRPAVARLARAAQVALAARGISPDDHVVLVDDADGSAALGAAICELAGLRRVSVVHGRGVHAWQARGRELAVGPAPAPGALPAVDLDAWTRTTPRPGVVAAFEDVVDAVVEPDGAHVVDARSQLEHEGIVGSPCCAGRGAIPGSIHLEWTAFFDMAGAPRPAEQVREIAAHVGLAPGDAVIVSCHAGHRAAVAARVLRSAGFGDVRLSIGSWHEWAGRGLVDDADDDADALDEA